jgi:RNA polymerase sigma-70 factor (ECF subfamily)
LRLRSASSCGARSTRICRRRSTVCPKAFREAVWLRDVEEFSYAEIAEMLNVPIGTVMSRISRGRRMLFEKLSPAAPVPAEAAGGRR